MIYNETGGRFIPACAGNSFLIGSECQFTTVHPRVCGEQSLAGLDFGLLSGSSPRVRGTVFLSDVGVSPGRFIPACAGNSLPRSGS